MAAIAFREISQLLKRLPKWYFLNRVAFYPAAGDGVVERVGGGGVVDGFGAEVLFVDDGSASGGGLGVAAGIVGVGEISQGKNTNIKDRLCLYLQRCKWSVIYSVR